MEKFTNVVCSPAFDLKKTPDLARWFELAEHMPPHMADSLISSLNRLAPLILWSAAILHHGGKGHNYEQWSSCREGTFARYGYLFVKEAPREVHVQEAVTGVFRP